jgi:LCP family protein required for cell wall assembly
MHRQPRQKKTADPYYPPVRYPAKASAAKKNTTEHKNAPVFRLSRKKLPRKTKLVWKGFIIRLLILLFIISIAVPAYYLYKLNSFKSDIASIEKEQPSFQKESFIESASSLLLNEKKTLRKAAENRINILLLGMGGEGHSGKYLTDTIILASVNPVTYQTALISIPRDLYIKIPEKNIYTKINAVYAYAINSGQSPAQAIQSVKETIREITGQNIDYYITADFNGFEQVINDLGGIDIEVPDDIYDNRYPGPNFSYETFEIKKGFHHLDGQTALKYARVRHTAGGDFSRAQRQQDIMSSVKRKAFSKDLFIHPARLSELIDTLGEHIRTDIQVSEFPAFLELSKNINTYQTVNKVLDAWSTDSLLASSHKPLGGTMAYVLLPNAANYSEIQELANNIFQLDTIKKKKEEIEKENATIGLMTQNDAEYHKIRTALKKIGFENITQPKDLVYDCPDQSVLYNNAKEPKFYTVDDLAKKLNTSVVDKEIPAADVDIILCFSTKDLKKYLQRNNSPEEEDEELKNKSVVNATGEVLFNQEQ